MARSEYKRVKDVKQKDGSAPWRMPCE